MKLANGNPGKPPDNAWPAIEGSAEAGEQLLQFAVLVKLIQALA
jgi:hypothetical protein